VSGTEQKTLLLFFYGCRKRRLNDQYSLLRWTAISTTTCLMLLCRNSYIWRRILHDVGRYLSRGKNWARFRPGGGRGGGLTADRYITDMLLDFLVIILPLVIIFTSKVFRENFWPKSKFVQWTGLPSAPTLISLSNCGTSLNEKLEQEIRPRRMSNNKDSITCVGGLSQERIKIVIRPIKNRLRAIIKGGNTKY
jgi:hypothetical protein